jgi:hypothetical protein
MRIDSQSCVILCNHGLISPSDLTEQIFRMGPPFIVETIGYLIFPRRKGPKESIPFKNSLVDVEKMLKIMIPLFDKEKMKNSIQDSYKTTDVRKYRTKEKGYHVPKEANYVVEMMGILRSWFPVSFMISSEVNVNEKYADIHLFDTESKLRKKERVIEDVDDVEEENDVEEEENSGIMGTMLELVSNERFSKKVKKVEQKESIIGHIDRATVYGAILKAEPWMLHFVTVCAFPKLVDVEWYQSE